VWYLNEVRGTALLAGGDAIFELVLLSGLFWIEERLLKGVVHDFVTAGLEATLVRPLFELVGFKAYKE
jgi:hypothetical protein